MIAQRSELILKNYVIVESKVSIVFPEGDQVEFDPIVATDEYPININFELEKRNDEDVYRIITFVKINDCEDKKPGYSIAATGIGFFAFPVDSSLTDEEKHQMLHISGLSICITNTRLFIKNLTSYYPWGGFSFHAVDINSLLSEKQKEVAQVVPTEKN